MTLAGDRVRGADGRDLVLVRGRWPRGPVALLGHGAGSCPDYVLRVFGPALADAGYWPVSWWQRGHGDRVDGTGGPGEPAAYTPDRYVADLDAVVAATNARLVVGLSLGAHVAAGWAAGLGAGTAATLDGLLLTLPAWTGPPDGVAAANAAVAAEIERRGVAGVLARITLEHPGWVADELAAQWPAHDPDGLVAVLRALAASAAPDRSELGRIRARVVIAGLAGDPMHPVEVARAWAAACPNSAYAEIDLATIAADRSSLGAAAVAALRQSKSDVGSPAPS